MASSMTCTVSSSAGLIHNTRLGKGVLTTDLRAFSSRDVGAAKAGEVDNRVYAAALGYALDNGHSVMAAYQGIGGATGCPYINNPYLANYVQYHDFGDGASKQHHQNVTLALRRAVRGSPTLTASWLPVEDG